MKSSRSEGKLTTRGSVSALRRRAIIVVPNKSWIPLFFSFLALPFIPLSGSRRSSVFRAQSCALMSVRPAAWALGVLVCNERTRFFRYFSSFLFLLVYTWGRSLRRYCLLPLAAMMREQYLWWITEQVETHKLFWIINWISVNWIVEDRMIWFYHCVMEFSLFWRAWDLNVICNCKRSSMCRIIINFNWLET